LKSLAMSIQAVFETPERSMSAISVDIAVLGAGLTGACTALELAHRGFDVLLIERDAIAMNRASLRNEGKIHLGLIYAADPSMTTAFLQLHGALRFRMLLRRWLGEDFDGVARSTPFRYVVARDSILTPAELSRHFRLVEERCRAELAKNPSLDYLGARPKRLVRRVPSGRGSTHFASGAFRAEYETEELAIDTEELAALVRRTIAAHPRITLAVNHLVTGIEDRGRTIRVAGTNPEGNWHADARHVVNATWESRLQLDRHFGLAVPPGWLHRLKYRIIARLPERLHDAPSATMVTGRYGDVVVRPNGTAYLSWYPVGLQGWTHDIAPPLTWDAACRGEVAEDLRARLTSAFLENIGAWFLGIEECRPLLVDAGAIVAYGTTDVDDKGSGLHDRARIGVATHGRYHSVDPGKLTTAPCFAKIAADRVASAIRSERGSATRIHATA
jgi:glycine/D-amino acid oxidase-like deaminating enzyme